MKKKRTIVISSILAAALLAFLPISAFAEAGGAKSESAETEVLVAEESAAGEGAEEPVKDPDGDLAAVFEDETGEAAERIAGDNLFSRLLDRLSASAGEIFAAVACGASLLLVLTYKKGFLPLVGGVLEKLLGTVRTLGDESKKQNENVSLFETRVGEKLAAAEEGLARLSRMLADLQTRLPDVEERNGERAVFSAVLAAQVDLLSDVFLSSSLPQYEKDAVAARVAAMKEAIRTAEGGDAHGNQKTH